MCPPPGKVKYKEEMKKGEGKEAKRYDMYRCLHIESMLKKNIVILKSKPSQDQPS